ncbi:MAG TPA: hypothetical protein PK452_16645 [Amaricoccus sp.]|uniref:hypothetical protein n=1 Tax=Amaricoccus sp. TaxID=1872485 RepID=UPI002B7B4CDA|nr:hypothetical protein [Amaricoccus sp.]HRO13157.1 hypothetical protein [Amaricoccus sp.]
MPRRSRIHDTLLFIALLSSAMALGGALAHLFELPNKIALPQEEYFIVQQVYRGWDRLGWLLLVELASIVAVAVLSRRDPRLFRPLLAAALLLLAAQAVFWTFTFPVNVATDNWTAVPEGWERLRARWEYSHAVGALFQLLVVASLILAALRR